MKKTILAILLILILTMALATTAFAAAPAGAAPLDVGNFSDYDSGGWDSGSDWSSSDWDSDWDSGSSSGDGFALGMLFGLLGDAGPIGFIIIIAIIVLGIIFGRKGKKGGSRPPQQRYVPTVMDHTDRIAVAVAEVDPLFSKDKFLGWAKEVFLTLQTAWMERDWDKIRPFEKEELFAQHQRQLQEYINNGTINVMERININQAYLHKYERDAEYEYLSVYMEVRMVDYIKREDNGAVVEGDPNKPLYNKYIYKFMRKTGVQTNPATSNKSVVACPHCGAPTSITSAGQCEYCGFIITTGEFDWVLADITGVGPTTSIDNSGVIIR